MDIKLKIKRKKKNTVFRKMGPRGCSTCCFNSKKAPLVSAFSTRSLDNQFSWKRAIRPASSPSLATSDLLKS